MLLQFEFAKIDIDVPPKITLLAPEATLAYEPSIVDPPLAVASTLLIISPPLKAQFTQPAIIVPPADTGACPPICPSPLALLLTPPIIVPPFVFGSIELYVPPKI